MYLYDESSRGSSYKSIDIGGYGFKIRIEKDYKPVEKFHCWCRMTGTDLGDFDTFEDAKEALYRFLKKQSEVWAEL